MAHWLKCIRATWGLVAVMTALGAPAATHPAVNELLRPLNLSGYPSTMRPPDFSGMTADGETLSSARLRGRVVLVNFWASWCLECRPEMPLFERLHRDFASKGLAVIGINARENSATIRQYARDLRLTFPLIADPNGKISKSFGVVGLPTTFVISRDGRPVGLAVGSRQWTGAQARALIEALLAEPAPPRANNGQ